jgi:hypothetical protein
MLSRFPEQRHRHKRIRHPFTRHSDQFGRLIESNDTINGSAVEPQIQGRPDADLENQTSGILARPLAIVVQQQVPH